MGIHKGTSLPLCSPSGGALRDPCGRGIYPGAAPPSVPGGSVSAATPQVWAGSLCQGGGPGGSTQLPQVLWTDSRKNPSFGYVHAYAVAIRCDPFLVASGVEKTRAESTGDLLCQGLGEVREKQGLGQA